MYGSTGQLAFIITNVFVKILTKTLIEINPQVLTRLDRCKIHNNICIIVKKNSKHHYLKKKWINIYRMNIIILLHKCFNYFSVLFIFLIGGKEKHNF